MSLTEALFVIAAILVIVDFFIVNDIATHIAYVIICFNVIRQFEVPLLYKILLGLIFWFALVVFHYTLWRRVVLRFTNKYIAPDMHIDGARGRVGSQGVVKAKDDKVLVLIQGDLWSVRTETDIVLKDGDKVEVVGEEDGILIVRLV